MACWIFLPDPGDQGLEKALSVHWCGFVPQPKLQLQSAPNSVGICSVLNERNICGFTPNMSIGGTIATDSKTKSTVTLKLHDIFSRDLMQCWSMGWGRLPGNLPAIYQ